MDVANIVAKLPDKWRSLNISRKLPPEELIDQYISVIHDINTITDDISLLKIPSYGEYIDIEEREGILFSNLFGNNLHSKHNTVEGCPIIRRRDITPTKNIYNTNQLDAFFRRVLIDYEEEIFSADSDIFNGVLRTYYTNRDLKIRDFNEIDSLILKAKQLFPYSRIYLIVGDQLQNYISHIYNTGKYKKCINIVHPAMDVYSRIFDREDMQFASCTIPRKQIANTVNSRIKRYDIHRKSGYWNISVNIEIIQKATILKAVSPTKGSSNRFANIDL